MRDVQLVGRASSAAGNSSTLWTMKPVSSASPSCATVFVCPPGRSSRSKSSTSCALRQARTPRPSPAMPVPTTAIRISNRYSHDVEERLSITRHVRWSTQPTIRIRTVRERTTFWSRLAGLVAVIVPPVGLVVGHGAPLEPRRQLALLAVLAVFYVPCGLGITVGWHRYFSHKSFETGRVVKATLAILGSMAMQGPLTQWVTDHRKHHALSDQPGDPALAARRPRPRPVGARAGALALARRLALLDEGPRARAGVREGSLRRHDDPLDRPALPALGRADGRAAVRDRLGGVRDLAGRDARRWSGAA